MRVPLILVLAALALPAAVAGQTVPVPRPAPGERAAVPAPIPPQVPPAPPVAPAPARRLTEAEQADFAARIAACWNPDTLPESARQVVITVAFELTADAMPIEDSFRLLGQGGGDDPSAEDVDLAFAAARSAVLRCGQQGYELPQQARAYWQHVQITLDPIQGALR